MKKAIFTSLLALLVMSLSYAQTFSSQNIKRNLPSQLASLLQKAQGKSPKSPRIATLRTPALKLDSTVRFIGYDLDPQDSVPVIRTIYKYPKPNITTAHTEQHNGNQWYTLGRLSEIRDQLGRINEILIDTFNTDSGKYLLNSRLLFYPHGNSPELLDSIVIYAWNPDLEGLEKNLSQHNFFNAQDKLLKTVTTIQISGLKFSSQETYTYNAAGENTLIEEFNVFEEVLLPAARTEISYIYGKPQEIILSLYQQGNFIPNDRQVFKYVSGGYYQDIFLWDETLSSWEKTQSFIYKTDAWERILWVDKSFKDLDGSPDEKQLELYTYLWPGDDANAEDLLREDFFLWDQTQSKYYLNERNFYYYGISTNVPELEVNAHNLRVYPNPGTDKVYLSSNQDAQVQVYNTAGQLMLSQQVLNGQALHIAVLPKGVYYFLAREKQNLYSGTLIKL